MGIESENKIPKSTSATGKIDEDSGMQMFRGMITPWDQIKSFRETYLFMVRQAALHAVAYMNALDILVPDVELRRSTMAENWGQQLQYLWDPSDPNGMIKPILDRHDIPPFMKKGLYAPACYVDFCDEMMTMGGYIWYATNDRMEKEIHNCPLDIIGPDCCDLSIVCGQYLCPGVGGGEEMNIYLTERRGEGDPYCHVVWEAKKKAGESVNGDHHIWENWGPPASGMRDYTEGQPRRKEAEFLTSGVYASALGATFTAGDMYKYAIQGPMGYSGHAVLAIRKLIKPEDMPQAENVVKVMFDAAGKHMFGDPAALKAVREWLGVPADVEDGRVMGAYISMILQARSVPWEFVQFDEIRTIIECDKFSFESFGQFPEFSTSYEAYFNGMIKTLVNTEWIVKLDENPPEGKVRYIIEKAVYGFRRQKPGYRFEK